MKASLIPNLLLSIEKNKRDFKNLKLFEIEKIFNFDVEKNKISESYNI
jgi:phenylalanyl-tRNA synthetase beta subunit